jgi:hypothetical protein
MLIQVPERRHLLLLETPWQHALRLRLHARPRRKRKRLQGTSKNSDVRGFVRV